MPIQEYLGFSHTLHLLPEFFRDSFFSGRIINPLPFKTLILTPPSKTVDNFLPLRFCWIFFVHVPGIISKPKNKNGQSEKDVDQVLYSEMNGQQYQNKHHGETVPKNSRHILMLSSDQDQKAHRARFSTAGYMWNNRAKRNFHPADIPQNM